MCGKTTLDQADAHRFDRFSTDVNEVFRRYRQEIPNIQKTKLPDEKLFAEVFVFWYLNEMGDKIYIKA
jgi:putative Ca2+/H+ antiporter (TMEM165/GDT1 family)